MSDEGPPVIALVGLLAGLITIFAFVTGIQNLPGFLVPADGEPTWEGNPISDEVKLPSRLIEGRVTETFRADPRGNMQGYSLATGTKGSRGSTDFAINHFEGQFNLATVDTWMLNLGAVDFGELARCPPHAPRRTLLGVTGQRPYSGLQLPIRVGHVYCISLGGRQYAKLHVINVSQGRSELTMSFEYVFQTNGSSVFQ